MWRNQKYEEKSAKKLLRGLRGMRLWGHGLTLFLQRVSYFRFYSWVFYLFLSKCHLGINAFSLTNPLLILYQAHKKRNILISFFHLKMGDFIWRAEKRALNELLFLPAVRESLLILGNSRRALTSNVLSL